MARLRRPAIEDNDVWPAELADPDSVTWSTDRYTEQWLYERGAQLSGAPHAQGSSVRRRSAAIEAWALAHHPSMRWPGRVDQEWMNSSGLGRVRQAASRARMLETFRRSA